MTNEQRKPEQLTNVVAEYLHWRKVNPHIKGGENYSKRMQAALSTQAELLKACEWQPIETAPKDGTMFVAWSKRDGMMNMVFYSQSSSETWSLGGRIKNPEPTHWAPLPKPPTAQGA